MRLNAKKLLKLGGPAFALVLLLSWYAGIWLGLAGWKLWVFRGSLALLGLLAVLLVLRLLPDRKRQAAGPSELADLVGFLRAAERRLMTSGVAGKGGLRTLPLVFLVGPARSARTSVVRNAGLELDFLAGDGEEGEPPPPTPNLNLWLRGDTVFVEVGQGVLKSEQGWGEVLGAARVGPWKGMMKEHPPRAMVVCVGCEWLKGDGRSDLAALAKELRGRLAEAASALDVRLPVYALFTKADQVPFFTEYARSLNDAEAAGPLGVTLPLAEGQDPGLYSQWQAARLRAVFEGVFQSLAHRRPDVMVREGDPAARASAYEFPREFSKLAEAATEFLVELTRPSQLSLSPFLRGFYFTGVRPVAASGRPETAAAPMAPQAPKGATMVFDPGAMAARPAARAGSPGRVPQWTFLRRLFPEVVLQDAVAVAASRGGPRAAFRRRALLASGAGLAALLVLALTVSFFGNRGLRRATEAAMGAVENVRAGVGTPSVEDLQSLDRLRAQVARLAGYRLDGPPLRLRWGLYAGNALFPHARRLYFARFRALLFESTRGALLASLGDLPSAPSQEQYESRYQHLKAYLITTSFADSSTVAFLAPTLLELWAAVNPVEEARLDLARRQFELYAQQLPLGNPYADPPDNLAVESTRAFLRANANEESFYAAMVSQANRQFPSVLYARDFPASARLLSNPVEVPGAFTRAGWDFVLQGLESARDFFQRDAWVVGPDFFAGIDPTAMAASLRERFQREYVQSWVRYLAGGRVAAFPAGAAEGSLSELAGPRSPIFQMLDLASRNTQVDSALVRPSFQPLHAVKPPELTDRLFGEAAQPYLARLGELAGAMGQLARNPGSPEAQQGAAASADGVQGEVNALRLAFNTSPEDAVAVGSAIEGLLRAPVRFSQSIIGGSGGTAMEDEGRELCRSDGVVLQRFPFANGGRDASLDELDAFLHPDAGSLWAFMEKVRGAGLTPSREFQGLVDRARAASRALYALDAASPRLRFRFRGQPTDQVPTISLNVDGNAESYSRNATPWGNFTWNAANAQEVRMRVQVGERPDSLIFRGTWALFKFFNQADWQASGDSWRLSWRLEGTGATVQADLDLAGAQPVLRRGFFDGLSCPARFVR